jgi:hypothetical protein
LVVLRSRRGRTVYALRLIYLAAERRGPPILGGDRVVSMVAGPSAPGQSRVTRLSGEVYKSRRTDLPPSGRHRT